MISLKSKIVQELLSYFFLQPKSSLYINEISRLLNLDRGNLVKKLKILEEEGILKSEYSGNQRYYSLNSDYPFLKEYRTIISKTIGFEKKARDVISKVKGVNHAYIFGSYAKNKIGPASDIDILAVGDQDTIELQKAISPLQSAINKEINVISISESELKKKKNDPFISSILKGNKIKII